MEGSKKAMEEMLDVHLSIPWWRPGLRQRALESLASLVRVMDGALRDQTEARSRLTGGNHPNTFLSKQQGALNTSPEMCQAITNTIWRMAQQVVSEAGEGHHNQAEVAVVGRQMFALRNTVVALASVTQMLAALHHELSDEDGLTDALVDFGIEVGAATWGETDVAAAAEGLDDGTIIPFRRPT